METKMIKTLGELAQTDIDAFHAYGTAINAVTVQHVKDSLLAFQGDHSRHITKLSELVVTLGGLPPTFSPDFKGMLIGGMTAVASLGGTHGALVAMRGNEEITNKAYEAALAVDMTAECRTLVQENLKDERRHRTAIQRWIDNKVWDAETTAYQAR